MTDKDARLEKVRDALNGLGVASLANMVEDISCPDSVMERLPSPGATFLRRVRDATLETLEYRLNDAETIREAVDAMRDEGDEVEIADGAVPVYTHNRMLTLVDLAAYHVDISDYYVDSSKTGPMDFVELAGVALYIVADRLVYALLDYVEGLEDEDEED